MPLDPVIGQLFAKMAESGRPALSAGSPGAARALTAASRAALGAGPALHHVQNLTVPTRSGSTGCGVSSQFARECKFGACCA